MLNISLKYRKLTFLNHTGTKNTAGSGKYFLINLFFINTFLFVNLFLNSNCNERKINGPYITQDNTNPEGKQDQES